MVYNYVHLLSLQSPIFHSIMYVPNRTVLLVLVCLCMYAFAACLYVCAHTCAVCVCVCACACVEGEGVGGCGCDVCVCLYDVCLRFKAHHNLALSTEEIHSLATSCRNPVHSERPTYCCRHPRRLLQVRASTVGVEGGGHSAPAVPHAWCSPQ